MNTLYYGDNRDILPRYVKDESVDLIYLDPPFNSNQSYNVLFAEQTGERSAAQIKAFEDTWHWDTETERWFMQVASRNDKVADLLIAFERFLGRNDMLAYLSNMAPCLIELRRVLKSTGAIYLHCDPTASHYLKLLMDAVFGAVNYRNEIVWKRTAFAGSSKAREKQFPKNHDTLLFYSKSEDYLYQPILLPYSDDYYRRFRNPDDDHRGPYQSVLLKTYSQDTFEKLKAENRLIPSDGPRNKWRYKQFITDLKGRQVEDLWTDINNINPVAAERLGYPTQKPEALLERIIQASSNEGDVVLDPFCGCGTAIAAAQKLNRQWIGIDITHLAITLIKKRLRDAFGDEIRDSYEVVGEPVDLEGAKALAEQDKWQFQWWALGQVDARPEEQKKGMDRGIDGRRTFFEGKERRPEQIIISVKGGGISSKDVRDLNGTIIREKAAIGLFITLKKPTREMIKEAAAAGFYTSDYSGTEHPRLQILTIEELLEGIRPDLPPLASAGWSDTTFKKAPKSRKKKADNEKLDL